jgi:TolB-like protein/Tfp pilus assembly protein PilF
MGYTSPEQLRGDQADARSDIFSFGCVLYEMLAGKSPFLKRTGAETVTAIMSEDAAPLSGTGRVIAPALQEIVSRCLEKRQEDRFSSAHDLALALRAYSGGSETPATVPVGLAARGGLLGRLRWPLLVTALVVIAAALAFLNVGSLRSRLLGRGSGPERTVKLAVLPFANLSGDPEQEYLSDGLTQEMIAQLGRLHPETLSVIARTSVMRYKKAETPIDQIGRELNADYILEGSEQREGGRVRITAELVKVQDQTQLWSETYERELSGILALQSEVARKVAEALALRLLPGEQARLASARAVDPDAYQAYLKGIQHFYRLTAGDFDSAQQYFELALAKDPSYALAYTGMALVWAGRGQLGFVSPAEAAPKAKAAARKAIGLDDTVAETHFALAALGAWVDWDWAVAEREFKRAIELNPSFPEARINYSHFLMNMGRPNEAMPQARRALELDPFNPYFHSFLAVDFLYVRQWDEAIAQARPVLATAPDDAIANAVLWYAFGAKGMHREALAAARAYLKALYDDRAVNEALERGFAEAGYQEAMRRAAQPLIAHFHKSYVCPMDIASLYVEARETSRAVDWLEKGYEVRDQSMPYIGWPPFDSLHSEPRFRSLLRRMNLPTK